jgi:DNA-binding PadR family transcriptional regulator
MTLTSSELNILLALSDRDRHGLGIADHIEDFTHGKVTMGPGTLYGGIKRLLERGLMADASRTPIDSDDPRRRYYTITAAGRRALEGQARELAHVVSVARAKRVL